MKARRAGATAFMYSLPLILKLVAQGWTAGLEPYLDLPSALQSVARCGLKAHNLCPTYKLGG